MTAAAGVARAQEAVRLGRNSRVVQQARLQPACADDAAQMRFALEDALATADFGDCGRLVLVRRLHLQAVPPRASPAWMARALEQAWRTAAARALPAEAPGSGDAPAVFFATPVQARLTWLQRAAQGADIGAWFWSAALPELKLLGAGADPRDVTATVVEALVVQGCAELMPALQAWPDEHSAALARRLPVDTLNRLLEVSTSSASPGHPQEVVATVPRDDAGLFDSPAGQVARRLAVHNSLSDPAAVWLAALWLAPLAGRQPSASQARAVLALSRRWPVERARSAADVAASDAQTADEPQPNRTRQVPCAEAAAVQGAPVGAVAGASPPALEPQAETPPGPAWRMASGLASPRQVASAARRLRRARPTLAGSPWPWLDDAQETSHGGLLLLVNLLQALQFERWLGAQPPGVRLPFVAAWFTEVLNCCGAPAHDPQFAWFAPTSSDVELLSQASFADGGRRIDTALALRTWRLRVRRVLRRHVGLDLPGLVTRAAWVSGTATHLDVVFPLAEVELRLRRRGLDSDPGWVAWFGRIVTFHFVEIDACPQPVHARENIDA